VTSADTSIRIALFHPCLIAGGIQRVFVNLARGFVERGLAVDLVQATPDGEFRHAVPKGVRLIDLNAGRALTSLLPLARYLRRERPQVVISGALQTNIVAVWAKKLALVPTRLILTEHNPVSVITANAKTLRARMSSFLVRRFYPWADDLVAVSQGTAADLATVLEIPLHDIEVIYNPIISPELYALAEEPLENPWFNPDSPPVVLAVGRLVYQKDFPTLLRAFARLRQQTAVRLVVLGDGEERNNLETLVTELGLAGEVMFCGSVQNPLPYMKRATVLASSSIWEALPTVLIEAMAVGLPIVATDCPVGPREVLCDGAYGTLVPVGDSERMAEALLDVLRAPSAPVIPQRALERFWQDHVIEQYLAVMGVPCAPRFVGEARK
jgi:glycosyltransferase involved in cell wall biosynthesis